MRRLIPLFIALSLLLSGCGTLEISLATPPPEITDIPVGSAPDATAEPGLSLASTSRDIQRAMLESATRWESIWMDGAVTYFAAEGTDSQPTASREQVWIDLPGSRFRILTGPAEDNVEKFKASDAMSVLEIDLKTGQSQSYPLPDMGPEKQFVPPLQPGFGYPQPLWGQMGTALSQLAFPSDFAQNEGTFTPIELERIAERDALVVEWTYVENELPSWRMWLDMETAVILKMQSFDKEGGEAIRSEVVVNQVIYNDTFADSLFRAPAASPQFSDIVGAPLVASEPPPTSSSDPDPLREVYFFVSDHSYGNEKVQLLRVPGSCAAGLSPCPEAEVISTPFDLRFSLTALVWSPDGDAAAFAYPVSQDGNRSALFLFDPQAETWRSLAEFNFIGPPLWSPDAGWLAFRVQDGEGGDEIYAVRRDGSQLTNLSANEDLAGGAPFALSGWINNNVVLHSRSSGAIYLLRVDDGAVKTLFDTPLTKPDLVVPSPDGYFLAYTDASDQKTVLKLLTPDGNPARDLATFQNTSIYPMVWSRDGASLAFAVTKGPDLASGQDVYVVGMDGRGLQQVYHSSFASIGAIIFSPDGNYLLFQDDAAAGRHIFVVDLLTLEQRRLQIPNLPLDWWWLVPSWRP
jgi:hypothetical protein